MNHPKLAILKDRAAMLQAARAFFHERGVIEVDCPIISDRASVDAHIDLIETDEGKFLHSSPEYGMKKLIAEGIGDIFQLSHVFRKEESGQWHNPEFTMAEWYRVGASFEEMIVETIEFIRLFLGPLSYRIMPYRDVFREFGGIDPYTTTEDTLLDVMAKEGIEAYDHIESEGIDALLNLILGTKIEPCLGDGELFVISHYPATQAALARKTVIDEIEVAERFEVYYKGRELANGYHELCDADEQQERLIEANAARVLMGKKALPIDDSFLEALKKGLPPCSGVAVGFDRLMMLRHSVCDIAEVL